MNKNNIEHWEHDGKLYSEWSDLSLDDDERHTEGIRLRVEVTISDFLTKEIAEGKLYTEMWRAYDAWVLETRGRI